MFPTLPLIGALVLFVVGVRLSAFFSGTETGFYRISFLRLNIDAQSGDRTAQRLLWFTQNPGYFVATTLVGNNVANYLATVAIGLAVAALFHADSGWMEIVGTLLLSPVVFVFGELMPKNLYYRAPMSLLRRDAAWFEFFFRLFLVVSFPLIWITKLFERFGNSESRPLELVLGRSRLVQVLGHGHREGLLTDVQSRLAHGLMHTAGQPVTEAMTPAGRVLGVTDDAAREDILEYARRYALSSVPVRKAESVNSWYAYVRVIDVAVSKKPISALRRPMPSVDASSSKLEAVLALHNVGEMFGVVCKNQTVLGIVSERGLVEQLFRPPSAVGARPQATA